MKFFIIFFILFIVGCADSKPSTSHPPPVLTQNNIQQISRANPVSQEVLRQETAYGCVTVPSKSTWQNMWVGLEFTGEICSATVGPNNQVSVSFIGSHFIPVKSTSTRQYRTDLFVGELPNNQVLVVQYLPDGRVISITQTVYNSHNQLVYGQVKGDFIKECIFDREENKRSNQNRSCP